MRSRVTAQFMLVLVVGWCLAVVSLAAAQPLTVAGFNVEAGQSDIKAVAKRVATQKDVDLWGVSEVLNDSWAETLRKAVAGATGDTARAVVFNESKLEYGRLSWSN